MIAHEHQHKKIGNIINRHVLKYFIYYRLKKISKILSGFTLFLEHKIQSCIMLFV